MSLDIVLFALVAAFLVHRLRSVLGTRHGEERQRPNPFSSSAENQSEEDRNDQNVIELKQDGDSDMIVDIPLPAKKLDIAQVVNDGLIKDDDTKLKEILTEIAAADASFDLYHFADGARSVFEMVLDSYAEGDLETLEGLLSQTLYKDFETAIRKREKDGHSLEMVMNDIQGMEIVEARLAGAMVYITVDYDVKQKQVLRDAKGEIIKGKGGRATRNHDLWTFARDIRSIDPTWMLIETRAA